MAVGCRRGTSREVRRGCCQRKAAAFYYGSCGLVGRHSDTHCIKAAACDRGYNISFRKYHCQRSGPEALCTLISKLRNFGRKPFKLRHISYMNYERIVGRSALGFKYLSHSGFVKGIGSKAVYSFRRYGYYLTLCQQRSSLIKSTV